MLPGIGGGELIVIAVVALIVVGPKDLPKLLRQLGKFVGRMRGMADDFRASFDDMARQSELDDLRKEVEALRSGKSISPLIDDLTTDMHAISNDVSNSLNPMSSYKGFGEVHSPDSFGGHEHPDDPMPSIAGPVEETPAKPKRSRTKAGKTATEHSVTSDALPEIASGVATQVTADVVTEVTPPVTKPKRSRAKAATKASVGDI